MCEDNTNADLETRQSWVQLARKLNVPIRCVLFTTSASLCMHNDAVRAFNTEAEGVCAILIFVTGGIAKH